MSQALKVSIESPQSGFVSVRLEAEGQRLVAAFSCEPYDSLRDLADSLAALLAGADSALVRWNAEPDEYDFRVASRGPSADFKVVRYANHRRRNGRVVFSADCTRLELCRAFWRELRELRRRSDTDCFAQNWRHTFPEDELRRLTTALRERKRESAA